MSGSHQKVFQLVVAATQNLGIGLKGGMPWKLPGDMAYFKDLTSRTIGGGHTLQPCCLSSPPSQGSAMCTASTTSCLRCMQSLAR